VATEQAGERADDGRDKFLTASPDGERSDGRETMMTEPALRGIRVGRDEDRFGERHDTGIGRVTFKVTTADSQGTLVVVELVHHTRGGPPRHRHHHQDEWFHVIEGDYVVAVGSDRFSLGPGDSAFGPRDIPHTWAFVGEAPGRIVLAVSPAGRFEAFLRALGQRQAMAPQDPAFWPPYDMELVGPPLAQALPAPVRPVPETFVTETSPPHADQRCGRR
jgi:quercetin dioxygenase-like cupin family protein